MVLPVSAFKKIYMTLSVCLLVLIKVVGPYHVAGCLESMRACAVQYLEPLMMHSFSRLMVTSALLTLTLRSIRLSSDACVLNGDDRSAQRSNTVSISKETFDAVPASSLSNIRRQL